MLLAVLIVLLMLIVAAGAIFMSYTHTTPQEAQRLLHLAAGYVQDKQKPPFHGRSHVNIMLLGTDVNFLDKGPARSDTIKIISVDLVKPSLAILSVPRDTWVEIPGHGQGKINGAYEHGGADEQSRIDMARSVIGGLLSDLSGEKIDIPYYVRIQTGGLVKIVDALGGVEVTVEKQMDYDDNYQNLYIHLKPGRQVLNGREAMGYVRFRHDAEGDYARMRRQDQFIRDLVAQVMKPENKENLPRLLGPILSMMKTNLSINDLLALRHVVNVIGMRGIYSVQLPTVPSMKGKASVVEVQDPDAAAKVIHEVLHGPRATVQVLDGTGKNAGRKIRERIDAETFNVIAVGTLATPVARTEVIAEPAFAKDAAPLATQFGTATVETTGTIPDANYGKHVPTPPPTAITVILGSDYTGQSAVSRGADVSL